MLKISPTQLNALSTASLDDFKMRLLAHLQRVFPEHENATITIETGLTKANAYGLTTELEICKFIDLSVIHGPDFDKGEPWLSVFKKAHNRPIFERALDEQYEAHLNQ